MQDLKKICPAILVCTCTSYVDVARATCNLLDIYWKDHPDIFIVGDEKTDKGGKIPFCCSEKDWIGMALSSARWLKEKGFTHCYLILDDHPPVGRCNATFLNNTLPKIAEQLKATHVTLSGWDQFQPKLGEIISVGSQRWMLNSVSYKWKFDLHPGYWNLSDFEDILHGVMEVSPRVYSAREFESVSGSGKLTLPSRFLNSTFKISGNRNVIENRWYQHRTTRWIVLYCLHALRLAARAGGQNFLRRIDKKIEIYTQYINGPYPMYWSGVIKKGKLNGNLGRFAELTGNSTLIKWLRSFDWPA